MPSQAWGPAAGGGGGLEEAPKGFLGMKPALSLTEPTRGAREEMGKALLAEAENKQKRGPGTGECQPESR